MRKDLEHWSVFFSPACFPKHLPRVQNKESKILAVDGGLEVVRALSFEPDAFVGDLDSSRGAPTGKNIQILPQKKDFLDGEAAIEFVKSRPLEKLDFYYFFQGRWDMSLTHLFMLFNLRELANILCLHTEESQIFFRDSGTTLHGRSTQRFSIIPLESMQGVSILGAEFTLNQGTLEPGTGWSLSNRFKNGPVELKLSKRSLYLIEVFS